MLKIISTLQRWLITGGAGYIGTHVADAFLADGKDVVITLTTSKQQK